MLFKFHYKNSNIVIPILKPKTSGAKISPFSSKNLAKTKYIIPNEELKVYKDLISNIPKEHILSVTHVTNAFIKSLSSKKNPLENIKADMKLAGLKGKEYIHYIGEWDKYILYLKNYIQENNFINALK